MDLDVNGLIYLLAQAGGALAAANVRITELTAENEKLLAAVSNE